MSQVKWKTKWTNPEGKEYRVEVMGGWDRPIQDYHLTIFNLDASDDEEDVLWDSMSQGGYPFKSTAPLETALSELGIDAPMDSKGIDFWEIVNFQDGNVVYNYSNGEWVKREV
jgi:hypothetical protein